MAVTGHEVAFYVHERDGFRLCNTLPDHPPLAGEGYLGCRVVFESLGGDTACARGHFSRLLSEEEWTSITNRGTHDDGMRSETGSPDSGADSSASSCDSECDSSENESERPEATISAHENAGRPGNPAKSETGESGTGYSQQMRSAEVNQGIGTEGAESNALAPKGAPRYSCRPRCHDGNVTDFLMLPCVHTVHACNS